METQKTILRKKNRAGRLILPDFRQYYKATLVKAEWQWHKNRHIDQHIEQDRKPQIYPCIHGQLIYNKGGKKIHWKRVNK